MSFWSDALKISTKALKAAADAKNKAVVGYNSNGDAIYTDVLQPNTVKPVTTTTIQPEYTDIIAFDEPKQAVITPYQQALMNVKDKATYSTYANKLSGLNDADFEMSLAKDSADGTYGGSTMENILNAKLASAINSGDTDAITEALASIRYYGGDITGNYSTDNVGQYLADWNNAGVMREAYGSKFPSNWNELVSGKFDNNNQTDAMMGYAVDKNGGDAAAVNKVINWELARGYYEAAASAAKYGTQYLGVDANNYNTENLYKTIGKAEKAEQAWSSKITDYLGDALNPFDEWQDLYNGNYASAITDMVDPSGLTKSTVKVIGNTADNVGSTLASAAGDVGQAINNTADSIGSDIKDFAENVVDGVNGSGDGSSDGGSWFSNYSKVNDIVQNGSQSALDQYKSNNAAALAPITEAKDAYNYKTQLDNFNEFNNNYNLNMQQYQADLEGNKNAAENWQTYMNPLTEYLNQQLAENAKGSAGSMLNSSATQNSINKAIADNTAAQYQNAVNTAMNQATQNASLTQQQATNLNSMMNNEQQRLENNVTPTTDWTSFMTDAADTQYNNQMNVVNTQAGIAAQQPTTAETWADLLKTGASVVGAIGSIV